MRVRRIKWNGDSTVQDSGLDIYKTRRILRALPRVRRRNIYFSILMWTTKYIYYYINLEDELLLRMHAHNQMVLIERDKWMTWRKEIQDNSLVRFVLIAKDKWIMWRKEV
jgi:hypothetical protein